MPPASARYNTASPSRVQKFPSSTYTLVDKPNESVLPPPLWRHMLRHDAESIYTLLLYWAIHARPKDLLLPETYIPIALWGALHSDNIEEKTATFTSVGPHTLHPAYSQLHLLLQELGAQLEHDHHWAPEGVLQEPEYVHEALQRLIIDFLIQHHASPFMDLEIADTHREVQRVPMTTNNKSSRTGTSTSSRYSGGVSSKRSTLVMTSGASGSSLKRPSPLEAEAEVSWFLSFCCFLCLMFLSGRPQKQETSQIKCYHIYVFRGIA